MPPGAFGSGAPKARAISGELSTGALISDQKRPWFSVRKIRPTAEVMMIWLLFSGLTAKLAPKVDGHCGSGVGPGFDCWSRPNVRPTPLTWKKSVKLPPQQGHQNW